MESSCFKGDIMGIKKLAFGLGTGVITFTFAALFAVQEIGVGVNPKAKPSDGKIKGMELERDLLDKYEGLGKKWFESQPYQEIYMTNKRGQKLCGYFLPPKDGQNTVAFLCHGYKSNAFRNPMLFVEHFHEHYGYGIFVMDHTAVGKSEGHFVGFSALESDDCIEWLHYLSKNVGDFQYIIQGVSMGGATVCQMVGKDLPDSVKFCIDDCGFTGGKQQFAYELELRGLPVHPIIDLFGFVNKLRAGYSLKETDTISKVRKAKCPMLFIHGEKDGFVPPFMAQELYDACPTDKELVMMKDATHAACAIYDPDLYWEKVDGFIKKYIK